MSRARGPIAQSQFRCRCCRVEVFRKVRLARAMPIRAWFPTYIYCEPLQKSGLARLNAGLAVECRRLREFDVAGRKWSAKNYPGGYTSYASMNELHRFSSTFADLEKKLT